MNGTSRGNFYISEMYMVECRWVIIDVTSGRNEDRTLKIDTTLLFISTEVYINTYRSSLSYANRYSRRSNGRN